MKHAPLICVIAALIAVISAGKINALAVAFFTAGFVLRK